MVGPSRDGEMTVDPGLLQKSGLNPCQINGEENECIDDQEHPYISASLRLGLHMFVPSLSFPAGHGGTNSLTSQWHLGSTAGPMILYV
jgi:hypothetical protein